MAIRPLSTLTQTNRAITVFDLPEEVLTQIFLRLIPCSLACTPLVCKQWRKICYNPKFKLKEVLLVKEHGKAFFNHIEAYNLSKKFCDQLKPEDVFQYGFLIKFLYQTCANLREIPTSYSAFDKTPLYNKDTIRFMRSMNNTVFWGIAQNPYFQKLTNNRQVGFVYNSFQVFCLLGPVTIAVFDLRTQEEFQLLAEGDGGGGLRQIACDDDHVFALCENGNVIQWDIYDRKQVRMIETCFSEVLNKKNPTYFFIDNKNVVLIYIYDDESKYAIEIILHDSMLVNKPLIFNHEECGHFSAIQDAKVYFVFGDGLKKCIKTFDIEKLSFEEPLPIPVHHVPVYARSFLGPSRSLQLDCMGKEYYFCIANHQIYILDKKLNEKKEVKGRLIDIPKNLNLVYLKLFNFKNYLILHGLNFLNEVDYKIHILIWDLERRVKIYSAPYDGDPRSIIAELNFNEVSFPRIKVVVKENCIIS